MAGRLLNWSLFLLRKISPISSQLPADLTPEEFRPILPIFWDFLATFGLFLDINLTILSQVKISCQEISSSSQISGLLDLVLPGGYILSTN